MSSMRRAASRRAWIALAAVACPLVAAGAASPRAQAAPKVPKPAVHRIGVQMVGDVAELFDRRTGLRFVLRGNNYARLDPNQGGTSHVTFGVGRYDAAGAEAALAAMQALGYNTTRVFMAGECPTGCIGNKSTKRLSGPYLANVADFLRRAKRHQILVILTMSFLPGGTLYETLVGRDASNLVQNVNLNYLTRGGIQAWQLFWQDVIKGLRARKAPLDDVLAYDIRNEMAYVNNAPPFSLTAGPLHAPNGQTYDLAKADARVRLMDDGLVYYVNRVRLAIRKVDPTALVDASFFVPEAPNPTRFGDIRILRTQGVIERSLADLVDIHIYPGFDLSLPQFMQNFGTSKPMRKVVILGEYGAFRDAYPSADQGLAAMKALQVATCSYGIDGWLLWTWDTTESGESLWNATDAGGLLAKGLAPKSRPDPCAP
jgi:hypothetical protein